MKSGKFGLPVIIALALVVSIITGPCDAFSQTYFSGGDTVILGMSEDGTLVGQVNDSSGFHGFIKKRQKPFEKIDFPDAIATAITALRGDCVLGYFTSQISLSLVGFKQCDGAEAVLYPIGDVTITVALRSDGAVVGFFGSFSGNGLVWRGFLQKTSSFVPEEYNVPGAKSTIIWAADDKGRLAGQFVDRQGGTHGFVQDGDKITRINVRKANGTVIAGMSRSCVVGFSYDENYSQTPFMRCGDLADGSGDTTFSVGRGTRPMVVLPDGTVAGFFFADIHKKVTRGTPP